MLKRRKQIERQFVDTGYAKYRITRYKTNIMGIHAISIIRYRLGAFDPEFTKYYLAPSMWLAYRLMPKMLSKC